MSLDKALAYYQYFNQGVFWLALEEGKMRIVDMDEGHRRNTLRWLEQRAAVFESWYSLGELTFLSRPRYREAVGEDENGNTITRGPALSEFDLMPESVAEEFPNWLQERADDPVGWMRETELYKALAIGVGPAPKIRFRGKVH